MCELAKSDASDSLDKLERLLLNGASAQAKEYDSRTALHIAASLGRSATCALLRRYGASPQQQDRWGHTGKCGTRTVSSANVHVLTFFLERFEERFLRFLSLSSLSLLFPTYPPPLTFSFTTQPQRKRVRTVTLSLPTHSTRTSRSVASEVARGSTLLAACSLYRSDEVFALSFKLPSSSLGATSRPNIQRRRR